MRSSTLGFVLADRPAAGLPKTESFLMTDSADNPGLSYDDALKAFSDQSLFENKTWRARRRPIR